MREFRTLQTKIGALAALQTVLQYKLPYNKKGVEGVEDIGYIKILRRSMWVIAAWPKGPNESHIFRYFTIFVITSCLGPGIIYLKNYTGKLSSFEMGHTYITVFMNSVSISRALMIFGSKYNEFLFYFLDEVHLFNYRGKSDYSYKTHILVHKICHFVTIYLIWLMCVGLTLFNVTPMYNNYTNGMYRDERPANVTFDHAIFYALPFDYKTSWKGYIALYFYNWYISIACSSYFCIIDLTLTLLVFHLWGHMRILKHNLEDIPKPASLLVESEEDEIKEHTYTEQESKEVTSRLREAINYHNVIINFQSKMTDCFGEVLLLYLLFHQVSLCLLMLECSQMDQQALLRYGTLTLVIFQQLIQLSVIFELLGTSNDKLIDSVYCVPWEYMDTANRKLVHVMMIKVQRSMNLKAMSIVTVGVQTMTTIFKTSFSYFVMLKTVAEEDQ